MILKVKRLTHTALLPKRATDGAAGYDLFADLSEEVIIPPGGRAMIPTGISIALPGSEYAALVYARSGLAVKHGITLSNGVGVVDSDYRGEIKVGLVNLSEEAFTVKPQDRIAQLVISPVVIPDLAESADLEETERGAGGFGSTGLSS